MANSEKLPPVMCDTVPSLPTVPQTSLCIFHEKWKIATEILLYIQNRPKKTWSKAETWQVPPRPGPSQGNLNPKLCLSGIKRELRANKTPFNKIKTVTWIVTLVFYLPQKNKAFFSRYFYFPPPPYSETIKWNNGGSEKKKGES